MKTWTFLILTLLLGFAPAASADDPTRLCGDPSLNAIFAPSAQAPAADNALFLTQGGPVCNPLCVTSQCSSHDECTAAPNGRCDFACPQTGCCVYPD